MGTYGPTHLLNDPTRSVSQVADLLAVGKAEWGRSRDLARSLEALRALADDMSRVAAGGVR